MSAELKLHHAPIVAPRLRNHTTAWDDRDLRARSFALGTADVMRFGPDAQASFKPGDVWLCRDEDGNPVGFNDDRHMLITGGTRGGKGTSFLIPNLLTWPGSAVVVDPKGENAVVTARRRAQGSSYARGMDQNVLILDPFGAAQSPYDDLSDLKGCFNPVDVLQPDRPESIDDAARLAESMVITGRAKHPFWEESARMMIKALLLHIASAPEYDGKRNLLTLRALIMAGELEMKSLLESNEADYVPTGFELLFEEMKRNLEQNPLKLYRIDSHMRGSNF